MKSLPLKAQLYILVLLASALALFGYAVTQVALQPVNILTVVIFTLAVFVTDLYPIGLPFDDNAEVTVSGAIKTAAAVLFGPSVTIMVTLLGTLLAEVTLRRTWYKAVFNASEMTLTSAAISVAYELTYDGIRDPFHSMRNTAAVGLMVLLFLVVNIGLVATIVSLATQSSYWNIWKANFRDSFWNNLTIIPLGAVAAALWIGHPWAVLALVLPILIVRQSFQFSIDLQHQTRDALISMADAIDQRDPSTYQHSRRVALIAEGIANQMGLPFENVETIRMAGRLHDLGKIGMNNTLLNKPGGFSEAEWIEMRKHPVIGAELVRSFRSFREGQNLILHHHESYDGSGYPLGLKGTEIPLGARVLCVADSIDAMTSHRVYRTPLALSTGVQEILKKRDKQFDPEVVDAFMQLLDISGADLPWPPEDIRLCRSMLATRSQPVEVAEAEKEPAQSVPQRSKASAHS